MSSVSSPIAPFVTRHIGLGEADTARMLDAVNASSMDAFLESVIPANIRRQDKMALPPACLLYTSPSPRDATLSRMPSSA